MDRQAVQQRFGILGRSPGIHHVINLVRQVARTDIGVLIEGESGTGKELVAHAIHELSRRRHGALKIINTGAIPEGLIESELFGAEKGAYTGATERRRGLFEEAHHGSVFLDEIGEMPAATQVRLLRVLETGSFNRVGSSKVHVTDTRVIAATNKNLGQEVEAGRFREDLYYRLSTVVIRTPPLRERQEDIVLLFEHFLHQFTQKYRSPRRQLMPDARAHLQSYRWPGNVREVRNVAEQVVVLHRRSNVDVAMLEPLLRGVSARGNAPMALMPVRGEQQGESSHELALIYRALLEIRHGLQELRQEFVDFVRSSPSVKEANRMYAPVESPKAVPLLRGPGQVSAVSEVQVTDYEIEPEESARPAAEELPTLEEAERKLIGRALKLYDGNRKATAEALGISTRTLYRKLKERNESPT